MTSYDTPLRVRTVTGDFTVADTSKLSVLYYFAYFLVILPLVGKFKKPRPLPNSISESVLHGEEAESAPIGVNPAPAAQ